MSVPDGDDWPGRDGTENTDPDNFGGSGLLSWSQIASALPDLKTFLLAFPAIGLGAADLLVGGNGGPGLLTDPVAFIRGQFLNLIIEFIVTPVFGFAISVFETIASSVLFIAFGEDRMLANYDSLGIVDLPVWLMLTLIDAFAPAGDVVLETIHSVNIAIATVAAKAGITAPIIVPGLWLAWFAAAGWITVTVVSAIDIPGIRAVSLFNRFLEPIRGFFRWFK